MHVRTFVALATSTSLFTLAAPAAAQSPEQGREASVAAVDDTIIVQARRRDESVQDVPLVVNAVTSESIEKLNIRDFREIETLVPGLTINQSGNGIGTQSTLRGIAYDVNASGNNGTIEFYMNDSPISSNILFQAMFDVGQIEVLRGPQGTLRGRASPSGSITVTTRTPVLDEAGAILLATINDIGGRNFNGALNIPLIADRLAVRIAGIRDVSNANLVDSINSDISPSQQTEGVRATVRAEPIDALSLHFSYTATDRRVTSFDQVESASIAAPGSPASPRLITGGDRLSTQIIPRYNRGKYKVYNWQAELRLLDQKLNYVGSRTDALNIGPGIADIGAFFSPAFPRAVLNAGNRATTESTQTAHEIRLSSDSRVAGIFDYVVGFFSNKFDSPTITDTDTLLFSGQPTPTNLARLITTRAIREGETNERSFFANLTAHITDRTELSGGVRRIRFASESSLTVAGAPIQAANEDRVLKATIYNASLKHRFNQGLMAYASFGTSWRPGGATNPIILRELVRITPTIAGYYFPPSEESKSYEVGVKSDWFDNRLRVNISAYHQTFDNLAYYSKNIFVGGTDAQGSNRVITANGLAVGVPAKVSGVEADIQFRASPEWSIGAVLSYAKSKMSNATIPCNDGDGNGIPDASTTPPSYAALLASSGGALIGTCNVTQRAGLAAPFSATVQSEYARPVTDFADGYLRGLVTFQGNSLNDPTNPIDSIESYALVNLFAGLRGSDGSWELGAYVKNAFETERVLSRNTAIYAAPYRVGATGFNGATTYRGITYTAPREFGVTARVAFGSR